MFPASAINVNLRCTIVNLVLPLKSVNETRLYKYNLKLVPLADRLRKLNLGIVL